MRRLTCCIVVFVLCAVGVSLAAPPAHRRHGSWDALDIDIMDGNVRAWRKALADGYPVNRRFGNGGTALNEAAGFGQTDIVRLLLAHGAVVNPPHNQRGRTALWEAANADLATVNSGPYSPNSSQQQAQAAAYLQIARLLLAKGADPNIPDKDGITPLDIAAFRGRTAIVEALLQARADPNRRDRYGKTPIEWAAYEGCPDIVQRLRAQGARIEPTRGLPAPEQRRLDEGLVAALMKQPYGSDANLSRIKEWLERGADPNASVIPPDMVSIETPPEMQDLISPFELCETPKAFALFLAHGANVEIHGDRGDYTRLLGPDAASTRLLLAYDARHHHGHLRLMPERLLQASIAASDTGDLGQMHVLLAQGVPIKIPRTDIITTRSAAALKILLAHGANIDAHGTNGRTQLMEIADEHYGEGGVPACDDVWATVLLRHGANSNRRDAQGWTALMLLAAQGKYGEYNSGNPVRFARLLLAHGAKLGLQNAKGQTALQIARRSGAISLVRLLISRRQWRPKSDHRRR